MIVRISPSNINGIIAAPASKSSMQRACAAALLHKGITHIFNAGVSNDDKAALSIIKQLGANAVFVDGMLQVTSTGFNANSINGDRSINCGESGLSIRMFSPIAALCATTINIKGEGSLQRRPMDFFDEIFPQLGIQIKSDEGKLPLQIKGPLQPKDITIDGSLSSQFLTGLLFAFADTVKDKVTITVNDLKSSPYIDLTLDVMKQFGYRVENFNYEKFVVSPKSKVAEIIEYTVEGDWSGASFLLVAGAIAGNVKVTGLDVNSTQADKAIMEVLKLSGAKINVTDDFIEIANADLNAFEFDATDCPDLFPPMVALAAFCKGTSIIKGTHRLAAKESDRALTLKDIFGKMGINIFLQNDEMIIEGGIVNAAEVSSHHDHRIAMAAAIAALGAQGAITISEADAINKSYPAFFDDLMQVSVGR